MAKPQAFLRRRGPVDAPDSGRTRADASGGKTRRRRAETLTRRSADLFSRASRRSGRTRRRANGTRQIRRAQSPRRRVALFRRTQHRGSSRRSRHFRGHGRARNAHGASLAAPRDGEMTPERWRQIEEIFQTIIERPPDERKSLLTQYCGGDAELRHEVESLLDYETAGAFIQEPIKGAAQSLSDELREDLIGRRLGAYRVTRLVGHGGMGAVYEATRADDQFDQQVAIKIIKRGMDTDFARERFTREQRILARLEHPHIARLIDGGATEDGLPYFVMEYVEGRPIGEYCDANQLSITERLKLFRQVCAAVQFAHQNLVVHRDIKPSNILAPPDGAPKLLDFGIAKLVNPDISDDPARTRTELRMLTPDYASPEQVRGLAITTASDIYSLGAVLYELLTGQRPHRFKSYSMSEIERVVCEAETEKPSAAVARETAAPAKLRKQLAGDLDNIILMAMRKEPERRYQ